MVRKIKNKVIVIGPNHYNTLGVIRSLGEEDVPVNLILVSRKENYVSKSKYVDKVWLVNESENEIISVLINYFNNEKYKPIIIPTSDFVMKIIDNNFKLLNDKYILPNINNEPGRITKLMNKMEMNHLAMEAGLTVPKSWEIGFNEGTLPFKEDITYPCIVKPLSSIDGKKEDIVICKNKTELDKNLLILKNNYKRILIQEYIDGYDSKMLEIIGCVTNSKEIIIPGIIEKIREYPLVAGSTSYALISKESKYIDINKVNNFLYKLNYVGIFDIEFKYSNGKPYFIEFNFRNGAPSYALTKAGVNIPYIWCLEAAGIGIDVLNKKIDKNLKLMMEVRDFRHVLNGDVKLRSWLTDLIQTKAFLFLNIKDMKPVVSVK